MSGPITVVGVDHVGFTVADIQQAVAFLTDALGFSTVSQVGPVPDPRLGEGISHDLTLLAAPDGQQVELVRYHGVKKDAGPPTQSETGAAHLALRVANVDAAAEALVRDHGMCSQGPSTTTPGEPGHRTTFQHLATPWGFAVELINREA